MASMVEFTDLEPLVLSDIVDFSLAGGVIRVLAADSVDVVFRLVLESSVEVRQLVTALTKFHWCSSLHLVRLLV